MTRRTRRREPRTESIDWYEWVCQDAAARRRLLLEAQARQERREQEAEQSEEREGAGERE